MKDVYCNIWWIATKIILGFFGAGVISSKPSFAQSTITPDNTLGTEASQVTPNVANPDGIKSELIEGGAQRGQNLFHSFQEFNVTEGRGAYFLVPNDTIQNVLARVTGTNRSEILGILGTTSNRNFAPTLANLFLINPNGIVFGRTASLDVNGSFVGTTANAVGFGGGFFSATNPQAPSELLTAAPSAFLFNQINAQASIQNNSVAPLRLNPLDYITSSDYFTSKGLRVSDGKSLLLVGGDINMDGGGLVALGGRVELGSLAGVGTVGLNGDGNNLSLSFPDSVERSDVSLTNDAGVRVSASDGGSIAVNARNLEMTEQSDLFAGIANGLGSDNSKAGNIDINATGAINLNVSYIQNLVQPGASGQGGDVNVSASTLRLESGAQVSAVTYSSGKGGNINVVASDVQLIGIRADGRLLSGLGATAESKSTEDAGDAGNINIQTNTLLVRDGAQVITGTWGAGKGGSLSVNASDVQLIGESTDVRFPSGLFASAQRNSTGDAGDLTINTNSLLVRDGANVRTSAFGAGKGGNLTVDAQDVQLIGTSANGRSASGLTVSAQPNSTGDAGDLTINTNTLLVQDRAQVSAGTFGAGNGGNLSINAQKVQLIGASANGRTASGLFTSAQRNATGAAGDLTINTHTLLVRDGAQVSAATFGVGKGGSLSVNASDVRLIGTSADGRIASGLNASTQLNATGGDAGDLTINTHTLLVRDGAQVSASTFGAGKGGSLSVNASDVQLIGTSAGGRIASGLFTSTQPNSTGDAGNLEITTSQLQVLDGASVNASTSGKGKGGDLTVNTDSLQLDNSRITGLSQGTGTAGNINLKIQNNFTASNGQVLTAARQSSGGNITITAGKNIFLRNNSDIKTILSTTAGSGGNITLTADAIVALEDSDILAFAPQGTGGNITFDTRAFLSDPLFPPSSQTADLNALDGNNRVDVNASGSILAGTISGIPDISLFQNSLIELAQNPIDTAALVASSCVVISNKRNGTFLITGKAGLPYRPGDAFASVYEAVDVRSVINDTFATKQPQRWKIGDPIVEPTGVYRLENGQHILSRECGK